MRVSMKVIVACLALAFAIGTGLGLVYCEVVVGADTGVQRDGRPLDSTMGD